MLKDHHTAKIARENISDPINYRNRKYYLEKAKKRNAVIRQEMFRIIGKYLTEHPCIDCGETDILVLEFDHLESAAKEDEVCKLMKRKVSLKRLHAEIAKCVVRCANCHRKKTAIETNNWKLTSAPVA